LKQFFLLVIFSCTTLLAQNYSFRAAYGWADASDLGQMLSFDREVHPANVNVIGMDGGYEIAENFIDWPWDFELKGSMYRYLENGYQDDIYELLFYIKGYIKFDFLSNQVRLGVGEGLSYTAGIITIEQQEAAANNDNNSRILNYLEFSLDFDSGKLLHIQTMKKLFIGYALKHRSGIFGLYNSVEKGGSNYNMFYIEKKF